MRADEETKRRSAPLRTHACCRRRRETEDIIACSERLEGWSKHAFQIVRRFTGLRARSRPGSSAMRRNVTGERGKRDVRRFLGGRGLRSRARQTSLSKGGRRSCTSSDVVCARSECAAFVTSSHLRTAAANGTMFFATAISHFPPLSYADLNGRMCECLDVFSGFKHAVSYLHLSDDLIARLLVRSHITESSSSSSSSRHWEVAEVRAEWIHGRR